MNNHFTLTGGARIGNANVTFPFATLFVDKDVLKVNASILGNLIFQSKDIISIEPFITIPVLGQGIKINHRVENYKPSVVFWTFKNPRFVITEIKKTGFLDNVSSISGFIPVEISNRHQQGGFPIKKKVAILFVVIWNVLFLSDFIPFFLQHKNKGIPLGNGVRIAIGLLLLTSILTLVSERFRKIILKEGRSFSDIKKFVYFIILISGFIFLSTLANSFSK